MEPDARPAAATSDEPVQVRETGRQGAVREYSVRIAAAYIEQCVTEQLTSLGQSVRLPGFRAGKIPMDVLRQRYGAKVRGDVVTRLAGELARRAVPEGGMLSSLDLVGGAAAGDLELKVVATCLRDLPVVDFTALTLERLVVDEPHPAADAMAISHLKQQVLDHLAKVYEFPIAPFLVAREFTAIWRAAEAHPELAGENRAELEAELRRVAERRVRLGVVVAETARVHEIRVSEAEVGSVRQAMSDKDRAAEPPAQTLSRLLEDKVIAWIVSRTQVKERRVTMEELGDL